MNAEGVSAALGLSPPEQDEVAGQRGLACSMLGLTKKVACAYSAPEGDISGIDTFTYT